MENQARKRQELELWQAVDPARNNTMRVRKNASGNQNRSDAQRKEDATISDYYRAGTKRPRTENEKIQVSRKAESAETKRPRKEIEHIRLSRTAGMSNTKRHRTEIEPIRVPRAAGASNAKRPRTEIEPIRVPRAAEPIKHNRPRSGVENRRVKRSVQPINTQRMPQTVQGAAMAGQAAARTKTQRQSVPRPRTKVHTAKKQKVKKQAGIYRIFAVLWIAILTTAVVFLGKTMYQSGPKENKSGKSRFVFEDAPIVKNEENKPVIQEDFLTISEYNRPGTKLATVRNIFVHYTANRKTSAAQNRSYFENLGTTHERAASAHFIIGYEGEVIQCIPLDEEAYAVKYRNKDSISIECCFINEDGSFTQETYDTLVEMLVWLTDKYDLEPQDILRHYDCGGKLCPIYYVEHEDAWQKLLYDVEHHTL